MKQRKSVSLYTSLMIYILLIERGISHLFPIQAKTYDHIFDGIDVIARASMCWLGYYSCSVGF